MPTTYWDLQVIDGFHPGVYYYKNTLDTISDCVKQCLMVPNCDRVAYQEDTKQCYLQTSDNYLPNDYSFVQDSGFAPHTLDENTLYKSVHIRKNDKGEEINSMCVENQWGCDTYIQGVYNVQDPDMTSFEWKSQLQRDPYRIGEMCNGPGRFVGKDDNVLYNATNGQTCGAIEFPYRLYTCKNACISNPDCYRFAAKIFPEEDGDWPDDDTTLVCRFYNKKNITDTIWYPLQHETLPKPSSDDLTSYNNPGSTNWAPPWGGIGVYFNVRKENGTEYKCWKDLYCAADHEAPPTSAPPISASPTSVTKKYWWLIIIIVFFIMIL